MILTHKKDFCEKNGLHLPDFSILLKKLPDSYKRVINFFTLDMLNMWLTIHMLQ
jgi:hypothetical protein